MKQVVLQFEDFGAFAGGVCLFKGFGQDENKTTKELKKFKTGDLVILAGPSGSGKSTLIERLASLPDKPGRTYQGSITLRLEGDSTKMQQTEHMGVNLSVSPGLRVGLVFQRGALFDELGVKGNLQFGIDHRPKDGAIINGQDRLEEWAENTKIKLSKSVRMLSGGQQRKVAIERTRLYGPDVILMDEPTAGLDPNSAAEVAEEIRRAAKTALVIVVTHEFAAYFSPEAAKGVGINQRVLLIDPEKQSIEEPSAEEIHERLAKISTPHVGDPPPPPLSQKIEAWIEWEPWSNLLIAALWPLGTSVRRIWWSFKELPQARWRWLWRFGAYEFKSAWVSASAVGYFILMGFLLGFTGSFFLQRDFPQREFAWPVVSDRVIAGFTFVSYRSIIPLFVSILFAARSGAALAADLGNRTFTEQVSAIRSFGGSENTYFVLPVFASFMSGLLVLQLLTFWASWLGSACAAYIVMEDQPLMSGWVTQSLRSLGPWWSLMVPWHHPWTWIKLTLIAFLTAAYTCHHGLRDKPDSQSVSTHAIQGVLWSTVLIVVVTFAFSMWEFRQ